MIRAHGAGERTVTETVTKMHDDTTPHEGADTGLPATAVTTTPEPRLPVLTVLAVAMVIPFVMPDQLLPGPVWSLPVVIACLIVAMAVTNPGNIDRRSHSAHRARLALVIVLVGSAAWSSIALAAGLIGGDSGIDSSAGLLLAAGASVWVQVVISFSFLYWELDMGGPGERHHLVREYPDLAFPEELSPEVCPSGWRPVFVDYLYVGVTNALAFSPTDVMPLAHWAKLAMAIQSLVSFLLVGLVLARAVNVLQ